MTPVVIIPCGQKKARTPQPAARLYQGPYFTACLRYALTQTSADRVYILSGKHGLLALADVVAPYNMKIGDPGCITASRVSQQAVTRGIANESNVVIVAGKSYARLAKTVWPEAHWLLEGQGRMGHQMQYLKRIGTN